MTDIIQELRGLIAACTKGDLSTAQRHIKAETVECPACHGDGEVEAADYCNFDGVALGVQFYGIGEQFGAHEKLWTAVSAHLPALLDRLEAAERGWQPIETAPRDGTWFWAFWPVHTAEDQQQATSWQPWYASDGPRFCNSADSIDWCQPTHWQPLPDTPAIREVKP